MNRRVSAAVHVFRNCGYFGYLPSANDSSLTVDADSDADIKMVLQGTFKKSVRDQLGQTHELDAMTDELVPVLSINGKTTRLGMFLPVSCTPSYDSETTEETISITAYDRCWLPQTTTGAKRVFFRKGTRYLDAVEKLLALSGIGVISKTPNDSVLAEDREDWDLGTNYLTIVNQLLNEINYAPLWFNATGSAVLQPYKTPTVKNIQHRLSSSDPTTLVRPGLTRSLDLYDSPNVFICVCDSPEKTATMTAVSRNTNKFSPLSIQRRGREIVKFTKVNNIANQEALQRYADRMLFESLINEEIFDVSTSLLLDWGIGDVVSLQYNDVHALCVSKSWKMNLKAGGSMTHKLKRIVYAMDTGEIK